MGVDLVMRVRRELDVSTLPPHVLYEAPTVEELARYITVGGDEQEPGEQRTARRRVPADDRQRVGAGARQKGADQ
jgi:hypothetical protein